jgi:hypothetical protein
MPPKGVLKVNVTDCDSSGVNQIAITDVLTVEAVIKNCCKKRGLSEHLPWWLVVSDAGEDPRTDGVRQPAPLLIAEILDDAASAGKILTGLVWTLLQDAAATAEAKAAADAKAMRAALKTSAAAPVVPDNFKIVCGILTSIGCFSSFPKFQAEDLDDSTLDDLQDEYLVAAGLSEHQAKLFIAELRTGDKKSGAAPAAAVREGSGSSQPSPMPRISLDCPDNFKNIAGALRRIGCGAFLQRFISEEIDDEMLGDLEQEHLVDLGMSVLQYVCMRPLFSFVLDLALQVRTIFARARACRRCGGSGCC